MADARRMGKSELFSHFAERFEMKRTQAREFFDELTALSEKELKRSGDLSRRCRPSPYLNNIIEQDHGFIKKRIAASL